MYQFLDVFFTVFHGAIVIFNMAGWIWYRTRRIHLATIGATLLSWTMLGLVYGFGYCPCTDWHWDVKRELGATNLPSSYIEFYLDRITPFDWSTDVVNVITVGVAIAAFLLSVTLNVRDILNRRRRRELEVDPRQE